MPDIAWLWIPIIEALGDDSGNSENNSVLNASRATRAGTRATRMLRVIRLIRMVRLVKLFKHYRLWWNDNKIIRGWSADSVETRNQLPTSLPNVATAGESWNQMVGEPSKVGKKLLTSTSKRVITLVLLIILFHLL